MKKARVDTGEAAAGAGGATLPGAVPGALNPLTGRPFSDRYRSILGKRVQLPVYLQRDDFVAMLNTHQTIVLVGETGSGKTTQARAAASVAASPQPP